MASLTKFITRNEQTKMDLDAVPAVEVCSDTTHHPVSATDNVSATDIVVSDTDNVSATDSRGKYQNEWKRNNKDTIRFDVKKGTKSFLQNEASKRGMSLTQLLKESVKLYLSTY